MTSILGRRSTIARTSESDPRANPVAGFFSRLLLSSVSSTSGKKKPNLSDGLRMEPFLGLFDPTRCSLIAMTSSSYPIFFFFGGERHSHRCHWPTRQARLISWASPMLPIFSTQGWINNIKGEKTERKYRSTPLSDCVLLFYQRARWHSYSND